MKAKNNLIVLVGNIGSGKSTLCKKYAKSGYIILNGTDNKRVWEQVWKNFNNIYEEPNINEGFDKIIKL